MRILLKTKETNGVLIGLTHIYQQLSSYAHTALWTVYELSGYGLVTSGKCDDEFFIMIERQTLSWDYIIHELLGLSQITHLDMESDGVINRILLFDASFWEIACEDGVCHQLYFTFLSEGHNAMLVS